MNKTRLPAMADAVEGLKFSTTIEPVKNDPELKLREIACVDFVCKLENWLAKASSMDHDDFIDDSSELGVALTDTLMTFCNDHLSGEAAEHVTKECAKASTVALAYREVLKTRPLSNALLRTFFWKVEESEDITKHHARLGESLIRACSATCYYAVLAIGGVDSKFGQEIDSSSFDFINDFKRQWHSQR